MSSEDQITQPPPPTHASPPAPGTLARQGLARVLRPYARYRARQAALASSVERLEADFEHVRERHTEQIDRLEDLVRELVLAVEVLRRASGKEREES